MLRKWLKILPHPFTAADRRAGYRYDISILQAEFSLTQMLDRPAVGRVFFETVIRENLDVGRPDQVIVDLRPAHLQRPQGPHPSRFRTRVITDGVTPSLHVEYKHAKIKQYHKEGRALRTETTINDTRDFWIGKRLCNLPALREVGFSANRRLLDAQTISHDPIIGDTVFTPDHPARSSSTANASPASASATPASTPSSPPSSSTGSSPPASPTATSRPSSPSSSVSTPATISSGMMTYDLRRLRLHGLIERIPHTHRYQPTPLGWRTAWFYHHAYNRFLRNGTADIADHASTSLLRRALEDLATRSGLAA